MAILRRTAARRPAADHAGTIRQGRLSLDLEGWHAHWAGAEVPLTVTEFSILRTLASMPAKVFSRDAIIDRSEEHTSELQSLMRISYAVFSLIIKKTLPQKETTHILRLKQIT